MAACFVIPSYLFDLVAFAVSVVVVPQAGKAVVVATTVAEHDSFGQNVRHLSQITADRIANDVLAIWSRALLVKLPTGIQKW
jgi:hypothetical protein